MEGDKQGCLELATRAVVMLQGRRKQLGDKWDAAPGLAVYLTAFETYETASSILYTSTHIYLELYKRSRRSWNVLRLQISSNVWFTATTSALIFKSSAQCCLMQMKDSRCDLRLYRGVGLVLTHPKTAIITEIYLAVVKLQSAAESSAAPLADPAPEGENTPGDTQIIEGSDPQAGHPEPTVPAAPAQPAVETQYASLSLLIGPLPMFDAIPPPLDSHMLRLIDPSYLVLRRLEIPGSVDSIHHLLMNERVLPSLTLADGVTVQVGDLGYLPSSPYTADGFASDFRKLCNIFEDGLASYAVERSANGSAWATGGRGTVREPLDGIEMFDGGVRSAIVLRQFL